MANSLFSALFRIFLKVRHTSRYLNFLLGYPFISAQKWVQIIKITHWVMICHFLFTCIPLLLGSVWQWKLIFFSLRGDITMINLNMEWRKLEDCCNMRSEINLLWCGKSCGIWGINKYGITLSVFSSNRKRASFGKAPLCRNVTLFGLPWDEKNLEMRFSLSIGHYFKITHTTCVADNWKIKLEARIRRKISSALLLFGVTLLILYLCITITGFTPKLVNHMWKRHSSITPTCGDHIYCISSPSLCPSHITWHSNHRDDQTLLKKSIHVDLF